MASGAAFRYLGDRLGNVNEIFGPSFAMEDGEIRRWASVTHTMTAMRRELPGSVRTWMERSTSGEPDVVVTDFEPLSGIYARLVAHPAGLRRQHPHDRPLPPRRGDRRGRARRTSASPAR